MCVNATSGRKLRRRCAVRLELGAESAQTGPMDYKVYILACADGSLYTGIARDIERRLREHNGEVAKGARYTSSRRPVRLVYEATFSSRSEALREEVRIKRLPRAQKLQLIAGMAASAAE